MNRLVTLPISTMEATYGPLIIKTERSLTVKYDWPSDENTIIWAEITFANVLAFCYSEEVVCMDAMLSTPAREMVEYADTPWLQETLDIWDNRVGWDEFQRQRGGRSRFKHYVVNFDDHGALQVICSRVEAKLCEPPRLDALP